MGVSGFDQCYCVEVCIWNWIKKNDYWFDVCKQSSSTGKTCLTLSFKFWIPPDLIMSQKLYQQRIWRSCRHEWSDISIQLQNELPNHIYTWCNAHSLNLVITDTAQCLTNTIYFFSLLEQTQVLPKNCTKDGKFIWNNKWWTQWTIESNWDDQKEI